VSQEREGLLHGHLIYDVHLIAFAPGNLTLRLSGKAPKDLPQKLETLLKKNRNEDWTIAISEEIGHPTLHEKAQSVLEKRRIAILETPVIKLLIESLPGTTLINIEGDE